MLKQIGEAGTRAIVIGTSMAGLLAARVLAEHAHEDARIVWRVMKQNLSPGRRKARLYEGEIYSGTDLLQHIDERRITND